MTVRLLCSGLSLALLLSLSWWHTSHYASVLQLAHTGLGSRPYVVLLKDRPVGQLTLSAERTVSGDLRYSSELAFQLSQGQPVRVHETREFAGRPPYALQQARQIDRAGTTESDVQLHLSPDGYQATVRRGAHTEQKTPDLHHTLIEYLAVESWLSQLELAVGTSAQFESFDFSALKVRRDSWTLDERLDSGYLVHKASLLDATRLQLDARFLPVSFTMAGTFEIAAVDPADLPIVPEPIFHSATYAVPLDRAIPRREATRSVTLRVHGNTDIVRSWEATRNRDDEVLLRSHRAMPRDAAANVTPERYLREELSYPISDQRVQRLARAAVNPLGTASQQAAQLTGFVHDYITYDHHSTMQNVLEVVASRRGDCNEYAELFTTLGRTLGLPVRTVIGLAYTDLEQPSFALHAWNEVLFGDQWYGFDPTWNEVELDATHIPLPQTGGGLLLGLSALDELRFEVVEVRYL